MAPCTLNTLNPLKHLFFYGPPFVTTPIPNITSLFSCINSMVEMNDLAKSDSVRLHADENYC